MPVQGPSVQNVISYGEKLIANYAYDYASSVISTGSLDLVSFNIPVVGTVLAWITSLFQAIFSTPTLAENPAWFNVGVAIPASVFPTIGAILTASAGFSYTGSTNPHLNFTQFGSICIAAGGSGYAFATFAKAPNPIIQLEQYATEIQTYQQKIITPFFISSQNMTPERQAVIFNSVAEPPLQFSPPGGDFDFVPEGYQVASLYKGEGGLIDAMTNGYSRYLSVINDVFVRRLYISVLDMPITTLEQYGQPENSPSIVQANVTTIDPNSSVQNGNNLVSETLPPTVTAPTISPLIPFGALALALMLSK